MVYTKENKNIKTSFNSDSSSIGGISFPFENVSGSEQLTTVRSLPYLINQSPLKNLVLELEELPNNWDSYGSPKIQPQALDTAYILAEFIELEGIPAPNICPVPGGGIQFECENATVTRELEIEINSDGSIDFLKIDKDEVIESNTFSIEEVGKIRSVLQWLMING